MQNIIDMRKVFLTLLLALAVLGTATAQNSQKKFAVGVGGGMLVSLGEIFLQLVFFISLQKNKSTF